MPPLERTVWRDVAACFGLFGRYLAGDRRLGCALVLLILTVEVVRAVATTGATVAMGAIIDAAAARRGAAASSALLLFAGMTLAAQFAFIAGTAAVNTVAIRWRRAMTERLVGRWLGERRYYHLGRDDRLDNPEQRIEFDLDRIPGTFLTLTTALFGQLVSAGLYAAVLLKVPVDGIRVMGTQLVVPGLYLWLAIGIGIGCTVGAHFAGRALVRLGSLRERAEADFRAAMHAIRANSLSIAFQCREADEARRLADRIAAIRRNWIAYTLVAMRHLAVSAFLSSIAVLTPILSAGSIMAGRAGVGQLSVTRDAFAQVSGIFAFIGRQYEVFAQLRASVSRVRQLDEAIDRPLPGGIRTVDGSADGGIRVAGLTIDFPDGGAMLRVGDFAVCLGERVLLRGRSGSGKSSFLRVLAGLWRHGAGEVTLPRGARMAFVPQRPHLADGPLRAVLAPAGNGTVADADAAALLHRLGLASLAARLGETADWGRILSPGEQQRVAAARAILARPDFLFIDEGTSALDPALEQRLYAEMVHELPNAAILSVAHRPDVAHFHDRIVTVVDGALVDGPSAAAVDRADPAPPVGSGRATIGTDPVAPGVEEARGLSLLGADLRYLATLVARYVWRDPVVGSLGIAAVVLLPFLGSALVVQQFAQFGAITDAVVARDAAGLWRHLRLTLLIVLAAPVVHAVMLGVNNGFQFRVRRILSDDMIDRWLGQRRYHWIEQRRGLDNPEQRIQEDIANLPDMTIGVARLLSASVSTISLYGAILWGLSSAPGMMLSAVPLPGLLMWAAVALGIAMTVTIQLVGGRLTAIEFQRQHFNAGFRLDLLRLRSGGEAAALERAEPFWHARLGDRFAHIVANWMAYIRVYTGYSAAVELWTVAITVIPVVVVLPAVLGGGMSVGQIGVVSQAFIGIALAIGVLATNYHLLARFRASVSRVRQLEAVLAEPETGDIALVDGADDGIVVEDLTIAYPDGATMVSVGDLTIARGDRILLRGRSGSGKSSVLRALAGLWRHGRGRIHVPHGARLVFVPQQTYLPEAPLIRILLPDGGDVAAAAILLRRLGLEALMPRLESTDRWMTVLSPGEQQRVAAAAAILSRPDFLFIDEGTSALDPALEARLYAEIVAALPDAAILSVAHRPDVARFHDRIVDMADLHGSPPPPSPKGPHR